VRAEEDGIDAATQAGQRLCIFWCIALSALISNRPRPMPDWLLATTTR
jgi:hypothetical protein